MSRPVLNGIVALIRQAQALASSIGIPNILQPGLVKEMIIAEILGHEVIYTKHDSDARDAKDPNVLFEYLSCLEGGTGQLDRVFNKPDDKRRASLQRIQRNHKIYLAIFFKKEPLRVKVIYELDPETVLKETEAKLDRSSNAISHVGFTEAWAKAIGKVVYSAS
jgi:hypothetical protein